VSKLLAGFHAQVDDALAGVRIASALAGGLLRRGAATLHGMLGEQFGDELRDLAEVAGAEVSEILLANLAYDLANAAACSTFVDTRGETPLHARNLDWSFRGKLLRKQTSVFSVERGPAGPYTMVGWPGFFGALTAVAPGRFSVTVNYVSHEDESGLVPALRRAVAGYWPVPWAVRRALDECESYDEAVRLLSELQLLSPVLLTLAGIRKRQALVIERGPDDYAHRDAEQGCLWVTNHYATEAYEDDNVDLGEFDTIERFNRLSAELSGKEAVGPKQALRILSHGEIEEPDTQHQVVMMPRTGRLLVRVPGGELTETHA
jgi:acid ceramidase